MFFLMVKDRLVGSKELETRLLVGSKELETRLLVRSTAMWSVLQEGFMVV